MTQRVIIFLNDVHVSINLENLILKNLLVFVVEYFNVLINFVYTLAILYRHILC